MEKNIKIKIPEGYNDAVFDKETNEIKFIKGSKLGDKVTIDGAEGYVLEVDDAGEPTVLCSEFLGKMSWYDAMTKANWAQWHLPTVVEFNKYYEIVRELDNNNLFPYWTSSAYNSFRGYYVYADKTNAFYDCIKTDSLHVRVFAYVGSKKDNKPRSWEEYRDQVKNTSCFTIGIKSMAGYVMEGNRRALPYVNEVNTEEEAKAVVALCKLIQLRDAWWGNWKPDWMDSNIKKYGIFVEKGELLYNTYFLHQNLFVFPTPEMRNEFLETFRDLLEEAKPLI